jgi:DNA-binding MarR family transcriptional regulator
VSDSEEQSRRFIRLYAEIFALFHRQIEKRTDLTPESLAVLSHFEMAGPLTITEAARHMDRAQSVMSELVTRLEDKGLLCRLSDERDRRRTLVWLTEKGSARLREEQQILSPERLKVAFERLPNEQGAELLRQLNTLVLVALERPMSDTKGEDR